MKTLELPDAIELRTAPELGPLALLDTALAFASHSLEHEHAELATVFHCAEINRAPEVLVASLLQQRFRELRGLLRMYVAAVHRCDPNDLPF
jgi:hypothetical protein